MDLAVEPGDVGLTRGRGFVDWAIRFAEARRYGKRSQQARWNHAFMIVDSDGSLVEAEGGGVVRETIANEYASADYVILRPDFPDGGAARAVAEMEAMVGSKYGYRVPPWLSRRRTPRACQGGPTCC